MALPWDVGWGVMTTLMTNGIRPDKEKRPQSSERGQGAHRLKRNRSSFGLAGQPLPKFDRAHSPPATAQRPNAARPPVPVAPKEIIIERIREEIVAELQQFARCQEDAAGTRYHNRLVKRLAQQGHAAE